MLCCAHFLSTPVYSPVARLPRKFSFLVSRTPPFLPPGSIVHVSVLISWSFCIIAMYRYRLLSFVFIHHFFTSIHYFSPVLCAFSFLFYRFSSQFLLFFLSFFCGVVLVERNHFSHFLVVDFLSFLFFFCLFFSMFHRCSQYASYF